MKLGTTSSPSSSLMLRAVWTLKEQEIKGRVYLQSFFFANAEVGLNFKGTRDQR